MWAYGAARMRTPVITVAVTIARVIVVMTIVVIVVVRINAGLTVPIVMAVRIAVIWVVVIAVVIDVQAVAEPANSKRCGNAPKESAIERMSVSVWVVVNGIRSRVVVIGRSRLIYNDALGLVVGHVDHIIFDRCYFYDSIVLRHGLVRIALQISCYVGLVTKRLNRSDNVRLLRYDGLAETPCLVEILGQQLNGFWIVDQSDNRIVPGLVWL